MRRDVFTGKGESKQPLDKEIVATFRDWQLLQAGQKISFNCQEPKLWRAVQYILVGVLLEGLLEPISNWKRNNHTETATHPKQCKNVWKNGKRLHIEDFETLI